MVKPPLEKKSNELSYNFGIIVPSTNYDKKISKTEFNNRIKGTKKFLSQMFGGTSSVNEVGSYVSDDGKLIDEEGVLVSTYMNLSQYRNNKNKIESYIKKKQKDWKQERIGFYFEEDLYTYPK